MSDIKTLDELVGQEVKEGEVNLLSEIKQYFPYIKTHKELLSSKDLKLEWLIDGILLEGGVSLLVAEPKTGKSVLARQLAYAVSTGKKVLNRKARQGLIFYISVEDHPAAIKDHMQRIGPNSDHNILWSLGRIKGKSFAEGIEYICSKIRPSMIVVDTLFKIFRVDDINNYNDMVDELQAVTEIARKYKTHIMYVHHVNKGGYQKNNFDLDNSRAEAKLSRIMGSTAIAGEVDNILFMVNQGGTRSLITTPRYGDRIEEVLYYDERKKVYLINEI